MNKVYIVTSGEYSDYHIDAVFSTELRAKEYIQQHGSDHTIEALTVDEEIKKENKLWEVDMTYDGFAIVSCTLPWGRYQKDTFCIYDRYDESRVLTQYIEADCMDRAIKIASERIVQIKANEHLLYAKAFQKVRVSAYSEAYPFVCYKTGEIWERKRTRTM